MGDFEYLFTITTSQVETRWDQVHGAITELNLLSQIFYMLLSDIRVPQDLRILTIFTY